MVDNKVADGDNPDDVDWCTSVAEERAAQYNIAGVNRQLVLGVMKHVIPAIAATNSVIAAMCVNEALKLTLGAPQLDNICSYNGQEVWREREKERK